MASINAINPQIANRTAAPEASGPAVKDTRNQKVLQAARMYEQQFLGEMVKAMRGTVDESDLMPAGMGEKIYRGQLDDKYVEEWSNTGGIGFADLIYNHIMEKYFTQPPPGGFHRPKGPLPLQGTPSFNMKMQESGSGKTQVHIQRQQASGTAAPQTLTSPWDAKAVLLEGHGVKAYILDHGNGLASTLSFDGTPVVQNGQTVKAGQKLALLDSNWKDIYWNVQRNS